MSSGPLRCGRHRAAGRADPAPGARPAARALLISRHNLAASGIDGGADLTDLTNIKAYVRHREDIDIVRELCAEAFSPSADIAFLNVDICRADLLVEIEGIVA